MTQFVVGFIGDSGVGKTTLMEKVVARLTSRGRTVSVVKSTHHETDVDKPGKDSWRYRRAGAGEVMLVGPGRWALMRETAEPAPLAEVISRMAEVDVILVEGYKAESWIPRIAVRRQGFAAKNPEAPLPAGVVAVATDEEGYTPPPGVAKLDLNSPGQVANFVMTRKANSSLL